MGDPARAVVGQRRVLQHFEPESGHGARDAAGPHGITGSRGHGASYENGTVGQHLDRLPAGAGDIDDLEHRPVRRDVAIDGESIGESGAIIGGGRDAEVADEMLTAEWLREDEGEDRGRD